GRLSGSNRLAWLLLADGEQFDVAANLPLPDSLAVRHLPFLRMAVQTAELHNQQQHVPLDRTRLLSATPVDSTRTCRFVWSQGAAGNGRPGFDELKSRLDEVLGFSLPVRMPGLVQLGSLGVSLASSFRQQRCILLGNAAYPSELLDNLLSNQGIADARA